MSKVSIRFYKDYEVRAIWDEEHFKWWFSVIDVVRVINNEADYNKNRNYWKYLKVKLKRGGSEVVSVTNQMKLTASDVKKHPSDVLDQGGVELLSKSFPNTKAAEFLDWFTYSDKTIDGCSRKKAYTFIESNFVYS